MSSEEKEILNYASLLPAKRKNDKKRSDEFKPVTLVENSRKKPTRLGRGRSSGHGKTCGRGQKGQKARSGYSRRAGFEGGQMPLHRRLPKRGFTNIFKKDFQLVNLGTLNSAGLSGEITPETLVKAGLIGTVKKRVKILGQGEISVSLTILADGFSESAKKKIEAAGGACNLREKLPSKVAKKAEAPAG